jgi:hypothetical protein
MNSAKTLFHDVSRAPVAVLLVVLGLCAGLGPLAGTGQSVRTAHSQSAFARLAASPSPLHASERLVVVTKGSIGERDSSLGPTPPFLVSQVATWVGSTVFGGHPIAGLRQFSANLYQARAPPAV